MEEVHLAQIMQGIRFYLLVVGDFWPGAAALIQSVRSHGRLESSAVEWCIFTDRIEPGATWAQSRPEPISVRAVEELGTFEPHPTMPKARFRECLRKVCLWELPPETGIRHVYMDTDLLCVGTLRGLEEIEPFAAASDDLFWGGNTKAPKSLNGGFFIFEPSQAVADHLRKSYAAAPARYHALAEQDLINESELGRQVHWLGSEWNFQNRFVKRYGRRVWESPPTPIRLIHFLGAKPWWPTQLKNTSDAGYGFLEAYWWRSYQTSGFDPFREKPLQARACRAPWDPKGALRGALIRIKQGL